MGGGPPDFPQGFSCLVVLRIPPGRLCLQVRGSHPLRPAFPKPFPWLPLLFGGPLPRDPKIPVWAPPRSLAATCGIDVSFSSSGYLDVSVPRVPLPALWIRAGMHGISPCGFPHSDIRGSTGICPSPRLFAACRVLLRLPVPRHPPRALLRLTSACALAQPAIRAFPSTCSTSTVCSAFGASRPLLLLLLLVFLASCCLLLPF